MYVPAQFRQEDVGELKRLMRAHDFATLVTTGPDGAPFATHLPLLVEEDPGDADALWLRSHMARANPQWKHFSTGADVLAIFHGPHALVHSNWYDSAPNVPTWNYAVVHAYGPATVLASAEETRDIAYRLVGRHTPDMRPIPAEFEQKLLLALVTFEIRVTRLEGKYKLNQNKDPDDRANVIGKLAASEHESERQTAELMRESQGGLPPALQSNYFAGTTALPSSK